MLGADAGDLTQTILGHGFSSPGISDRLTQPAEERFIGQWIFLLPDKNNRRHFFCEPCVDGVKRHIYRRIPALRGKHASYEWRLFFHFQSRSAAKQSGARRMPERFSARFVCRGRRNGLKIKRKPEI